MENSFNYLDFILVGFRKRMERTVEITKLYGLYRNNLILEKYCKGEISVFARRNTKTTFRTPCCVVTSHTQSMVLHFKVTFCCWH